MRSLILGIVAALLLTNPVDAQQLRSVFLEELTTIEVGEAIAGGYTTIILPTGGTEQNGPHLTIGKHKYIVNYASEGIARILGNTLVAPVVTYVPEGDVEPPSGHMRYPGTITLPNEYFMKLIEFAARSFRVHGFTDIVFIADSGGNLTGMEAVAEQLNMEWEEETTRVHFADDYYTNNGFIQWLMEQGESSESMGSHASVDTTSELLFVAPEHVRMDELETASGPEWSDMTGDPTRANVDYGRNGLRLKIDAAVRQIRILMGQGQNEGIGGLEPS